MADQRDAQPGRRSPFVNRGTGSQASLNPSAVLARRPRVVPQKRISARGGEAGVQKQAIEDGGNGGNPIAIITKTASGDRESSLEHRGTDAYRCAPFRPCTGVELPVFARHEYRTWELDKWAVRGAARRWS